MTTAKVQEALLTAEKEYQLPKDVISNLNIVLQTFVRNDLIVRMMPFAEQPNARVVANLDLPGALRTDTDSLIFRFGCAPRDPWTMFGQVAAIPLSGDGTYLYAGTLGPEIDTALQGLFNGFRSLEGLVSSVAYPEIAVIPIAIYRG